MLILERLGGKHTFYERLPGFAKMAITFVIVCFTWVFFRAADLPAAVEYCSSMLGLTTPQSGAGLLGGLIYQPYYVVSTDPSMALLDNDGAASSVTVSLTGDYADWNGNARIANDLQSDYIILLGDGAVGFPSPPLKMTVSGLTPNTNYNVRLFSGFNTARDMNILVDTNGDGSLTDETAVYGAAGGAATTLAFSSSGTGDMLAEVTGLLVAGRKSAASATRSPL